jgi:hypothetical protein
LQLLSDAYGDDALSWARVFEWHRWFILGRVLVEDDTRSGRPLSSQNKDSMVRIRDMVQEDRSVTVCMLADALNISKLTCHQILREDLGKQKFTARLVRTHSLRIKWRYDLRFMLICYMRHRMIPHSSRVSLLRMNHGVSCMTLRRRGKAWNGSQWVHQHQRKWGGSHRKQKLW